MCCEHLVCANCAGPVSEGRCPVCRNSREQLGHHTASHMSPALLTALFIILALSMVLITR
jgi:hypothetical protein